MYRKTMLARVELFHVREAAGEFETGTTLTLNLFTAYLKITLPSLLNHCFSIHYSIFCFSDVMKYFAQGILVTSDFHL